MKTWLKILTIVLGCFLTASGRAHIGSPIVVFEGNAGPYPLRVIIRPPLVIPGRAEIDVRFLGETNDKIKVTVLPVSAGAGLRGAPPPDDAPPVRGDLSLRHGELWLMTSGPYSVHVEVKGAEGAGKVIVPVMAAAIQEPTMSTPLKIVLGGLGCLLFCSAVTLVGVGARESILPPGMGPTASGKWRSTLAMGAAVIICALGLYQGKQWWETEDRRYRSNQMYRPLPMAAATRVESGERLLRLTLANDPRSVEAELLPLIPDHGKLMHLFMIREPQLDAFAHVHPIRISESNFDLAVPPLPAGRYRLYADITFENGLASTLTTTVELPKPEDKFAQTKSVLAPDSDDSWSTTSPSDPPVSHEFGLKNIIAGELRVAQPVSLKFQAVDRAGEPIEIEPYMGMLGHAAVRRADGSVFAHLHPVGTISMASQSFFEKQAARQMPLTAAGPTDHSAMDHAHMHHSASAATSVSFPYEFPTDGKYRLWVQTKVQGHVITGVFDLDVSAK